MLEGSTNARTSSSQKGAADTPVENMSAMQRGQLAAKEKLERENKRAEVAARGNGERKDGGGSGGSPGPQLEKMSAMQRGLLAAKEKMEREKKRAEAKERAEAGAHKDGEGLLAIVELAGLAAKEKAEDARRRAEAETEAEAEATKKTTERQPRSPLKGSSNISDSGTRQTSRRSVFSSKGLSSRSSLWTTGPTKETSKRVSLFGKGGSRASSLGAVGEPSTGKNGLTRKGNMERVSLFLSGKGGSRASSVGAVSEPSTGKNGLTRKGSMERVSLFLSGKGGSRASSLGAVGEPSMGESGPRKDVADQGAAMLPVEKMSAMQRGQLAAKEKLEREKRRAEAAQKMAEEEAAQEMRELEAAKEERKTRTDDLRRKMKEAREERETKEAKWAKMTAAERGAEAAREKVLIFKPTLITRTPHKRHHNSALTTTRMRSLTCYTCDLFAAGGQDEGEGSSAGSSSRDTGSGGRSREVTHKIYQPHHHVTSMLRRYCSRMPTIET